MRSTRSRRRHRELILPLEARQMLSTTVASLSSQEVVVATPPPVLANLTTPSNNTVNLSSFFTDPNVPGTVVEFSTTSGTFDVALTDSATPETVANFLSYVKSGAYDSTFFHRSVVLSTNKGGTPSAPSDIVQGGGYNLGSSGITAIPTNAPIADQASQEQLDNVAGTIAMARTSATDSATDEFYFNVHDNPDLDPSSSSAGYATFGHVLGASTVPATIAALPTYNLGSGFETVPVTGITEASITANTAQITANNLVYINSVTVIGGTTYTVTSSDSSLVNPSVNGSSLSFTYASGKTGTAVINVVAKNPDGTTATSSFDVTVPDSTNTTQGPTVAPVTSGAIQTGTTGTVNPLANDTDSVAALNASTVSIVTQPAHGTATFNASSGLIQYTPTAGYTGADTLTYTVADTAGTVSSAGTVNLNVVPGPVQVTIGTASAKYLVWTEPTGQTAKLSVTGATAVVTFADYQVTTSTKNGFITATGAGATIESIKYLAIKTGVGSITITSSAPISVGSITSDTRIKTISAPTTTFTGTIQVGGGLGGGLTELKAAGLNGATLEFGGPPGRGAIVIAPTVVNSDINTTGSIGEIVSNSWTITDGGAHSIKAAFVGSLQVPGTFAEGMDLTGGGYDILNAKVNAPSGSWTLQGSLFHSTLINPATTWGLNMGGIIQQLNITGNLSSTIQAAAINQLNVKGSMTNAVVQTDATFNARSSQLGSVKVAGAMTNSVIFATGNIGSISASSFSGSRIYAGVTQTLAQNLQLPTTKSDYTADAKINSVVATSPKSTFANTLIAADILGTVRTGIITTSNSGTAFGISGTVIGSISGVLTPATKFAFGKAQLKTAATLAAYITAKKLTLGDFGIDIV